jgi:hypothetical protein
MRLMWLRTGRYSTTAVTTPRDEESAALHDVTQSYGWSVD